MADKTYNIDILTGEAKQNVDSLNNSLQTGIDKAQAAAEKYDNVTKVVTGVAAGFQGATAAMSLMGIESEETTELILKLQSAMALTDSFKKISEGVGSFFKLKAATDATSKSMSGLKKTLIGTGIGLIVILIADLIANFDDLRKEMEWLDKTCTVLEDVWNGLVGVFKNGKNVLKEFGDMVLTALLAPIKSYLAALKGVGEALVKVFQGDFEGAKNSVVNAGKDMKKAFTDVADETKEFTNEINTGYVNGQKTAAEETKKTTKTIKDQGKALVDYLKLIKQYEKEIRQNTLSEYENALADEEEWYKEQYEQAKGNKDALAKLEEDHNLRLQKIEDEEKKRKEEEALREADEQEQRRQKELDAEQQLAEDRQSIIDENRRNKQTDYENQLEDLDTWYNETYNKIKGDEEAEIALRELYEKKKQQIVEDSTQEQYEILSAANQQIIGFTDQLVSGISSILGSIASTMDEDSEAYKAIMVTLTVIDTLWGGFKAFISCLDAFPAPYNFIAGGVAAASVAASGAATISLILSANENTNVSGASAGIVSNIVSPSAISSANQQTPTLTVLTDDVDTEEVKTVVLITDINKEQKNLNKKKTQVKF